MQNFEIGGNVFIVATAIAFKEFEALHLNERAVEVRALFCVDQATRRAFGGPPYTEDIIRELKNAGLAKLGQIPPRKRFALGTSLLTKEGQLSGYASFTLVNHASPTAHERTHVWSNCPPETIHGIFLRRLVVHPNARRSGLAKGLIYDLLKVADQKNMRCYADILAENTPMRYCAEKTGGLRNMFWHTPQGSLMVRYIW